MIRAVASLLLLASAACHSTPPPSAPDRPALDLLDQLAADTPTSTMGEFWPTVPEVIRRSFDRPASAGDEPNQLAAASRRLANWSFGSAHTDAHLRRAIEGLALAEPIAFAPATNPDRLAAMGLVYRLWAALDSQSFVDWTKTATKLTIDRKLLEMLAAAAPPMRRYLAGQLLGTHPRPPQVAEVLRDAARRARDDGNFRRSRELDAELVRREGAAAPAEDWIDAGEAAVRLDDVVAAKTAAGHVHELVAKRSDDRHVRALAHALDTDITSLERLLAIARSTDIAQKIEGIDLMRQLERNKDALAAIDQLRKAHPEDARVRVRYAAATFENIAINGQALEGALQVAGELADPALLSSTKDADYWSMLIGALGLRAVHEALPELGTNPQKAIDILGKLKELAGELAATRPGRAAILVFVVDHAIPLIDKMKSNDTSAMVATLRNGLAEAVALRAKYPDTADADHLVDLMAMFAPDHVAALAAVAQKPGVAPDQDADTYLQRARTGVSLAMSVATPAAVATARQLVDDVPPSIVPKYEATREALLGDCDAVEATLHPDPARWTKAEAHYLAARELDDDIEPRIVNNLGWIVLQRGDTAHAIELFHRSAEMPSERQWLASLNAGLASQDASVRLATARGLRVAGKDSITLLAWIVKLSPDATEAGAAAREALDAMSDSFQAVKLDYGRHGFEGEGFFQLGLGIGSRRYYELDTQAYTNLWLMPPFPLDHAGLEAKAKAVAKPAKKPKSP
jgi:tetratricopeptide (TPR) repeat protein